MPVRKVKAIRPRKAYIAQEKASLNLSFGHRISTLKVARAVNSTP